MLGVPLGAACWGRCADCVGCDVYFALGMPRVVCSVGLVVCAGYINVYIYTYTHIHGEVVVRVRFECILELLASVLKLCHTVPDREGCHGSHNI